MNTERQNILHRDLRGFTLMELMVVIVILGILMTMAASTFFGATDEATRTQAKKQVDDVRAAVERYKLKHNKLPSDLQVLLEDDEKNFGQAYLDGEHMLVDPWDTPLEYEKDGSKYEIISYAADQAEGGEFFDEDISSHKPLTSIESD